MANKEYLCKILHLFLKKSIHPGEMTQSILKRTLTLKKATGAKMSEMFLFPAPFSTSIPLRTYIKNEQLP